MTTNTTPSGVSLGPADVLPQPSRGREIARWIVLGGLGLLLLALIVLVLGRPNAEEFVEETYARHVSYDEHGLEGHIATGTVGDVVDEISDGTGRPLDLRYADGAAFMKYKKHIVAIFPEGNRTRVYADNYRTVWRAYSQYTDRWWSRNPPSSNGGYRGGGFGAGK